MNRIVHFEIHVDEPQRAIDFYTAVFGWEIKKWDSPQMEYWMVMTGDNEKERGINGGMLRRSQASPKDDRHVNGYVCTMIVEDIDKMMSAIEDAGGKLVTPKFKIGEMAWQAYYKDTEGNMFGIHEPIKSDMNKK